MYDTVLILEGTRPVKYYKGTTLLHTVNTASGNYYFQANPEGNTAHCFTKIDPHLEGEYLENRLKK